MAKVAQWQQSLYAVDSGINSGATTVRDDNGEYTTREYNYTVTSVSREEPGKTTSSEQALGLHYIWPVLSSSSSSSSSSSPLRRC